MTRPVGRRVTRRDRRVAGLAERIRRTAPLAMQTGVGAGGEVVEIAELFVLTRRAVNAEPSGPQGGGRAALAEAGRGQQSARRHTLNRG